MEKLINKLFLQSGIKLMGGITMTGLSDEKYSGKTSLRNIFIAALSPFLINSVIQGQTAQSSIEDSLRTDSAFVLYNVNESSLDSLDRAEILRNLASFGRRAFVDSIGITGYSSSEGDSGDNIPLSENRARGVFEFIRNNYFNAVGNTAADSAGFNHIGYNFFGETNLFSTGELSPNRRTSISFRGRDRGLLFYSPLNLIKHLSARLDTLNSQVSDLRAMQGHFNRLMTAMGDTNNLGDDNTREIKDNLSFLEEILNSDGGFYPSLVASVDSLRNNLSRLGNSYNSAIWRERNAVSTTHTEPDLRRYEEISSRINSLLSGSSTRPIRISGLEGELRLDSLGLSDETASVKRLNGKISSLGKRLIGYMGKDRLYSEIDSASRIELSGIRSLYQPRLDSLKALNALTTGRLIESDKRAITELIETIDRILSPKTAVAQKPKNKSSEYPKLYHEGFGGLGADILIDLNKNRWYGGSLDFNFGNSLLRLGVNYGYNARNEFTESWGERDAYGHQGYSSTDRETKTSSGSSSLMLVNPLGNSLNFGIGPLVYTQVEEVKDRIRERLYRDGQIIGTEPSYYRTKRSSHTIGGLRTGLDLNISRRFALSGGAELVKGHSPKYIIGVRARG